MILIMLLCVLCLGINGADMHLDLESALHPSASEEEIAESIINGFFLDNGHTIRPKVKPVLTDRIKQESQEIKIVLAKATIAHTPLSHSNGDPISTKILELMADALDEVMELDEHERRSRCSRLSTIAIATAIGVTGTTLGAVISAIVTASIDC